MGGAVTSCLTTFLHGVYRNKFISYPHFLNLKVYVKAGVSVRVRVSVGVSVRVSVKNV